MPLLRAALSWNFVLVTAVCASLLAQLIKVLLNLFIFHRFIAERMCCLLYTSDAADD